MPFSFFKSEPYPYLDSDIPNTYPPLCQEAIANALKIWTDEIARLKGLNIPPPILKEPHKTKCTKKRIPKGRACGERDCKEHPEIPAHYELDLEITFPKYEPPPHLLFPLLDITVSPRRTVYCFISGDATTVERAKKLYDACDLRGLLNNFPVRFFSEERWIKNEGDWKQEHWTHNPYYFFTNPRTHLSGSKHKAAVRGKNEWKHPVEFWDMPKPPYFEETTFLTTETLDIVEDRLMLLRKFLSGSSPSLGEALISGYSKNKPSLPYKFDDTFLLNAVLPEKNCAAEIITLKLLPSSDIKSSIIEEFYDRIRPHLETPSAFELVSNGTSIYFQISFAKAAQEHIERQLNLFFPDFGIQEVAAEATPAHNYYTLIVVPESVYSFIKTNNAFSLDPYSQLLGILSSLDPDERVITQIIFEPFPDITFNRLAELTGNQQPERNRQLAKKQLPWAIKLAIYSTNKIAIEKIKTNFIGQYETPEQHWLYSDLREAQSLSRNLEIYGIVNSTELAALAHFPDKTVECELLETAQMKAKHPPELYTQSGIQLGTSEARGLTKPVKLPETVRDKHLYVVGKSGTGKSTLLFNCIRQDIEAGSGVAVIDPHGDLVDDVLQYIPEHRVGDTIYFNAADKDFPIGLNIFNATSEDEIGILADDLLITFKRLSDAWGERMENILRYSFHTLLRYEDATFLDIRAMLQKPDFRERVLSKVKHPTLRDFWQYEYPSYPKDAAQPILNRMSKFSLSPVMSSILGQPEAALNFYDVLQNKKILLVKLSKGQIGEDTAHLLGSLVVSQLQLAVMRRAAMPKESRDPYYLYVDEFQNFTTSAFEKILSEARKYKLCLTLAHQYISQIDEKTKNAILANVGTMIMFQSYPQDAAALRPELGQYEPSDVTNLSSQDHEALCKPATQSKDTFKFKTLAPPPRPQSFAAEIIELTREIYSTGIVKEEPERKVTAVADSPLAQEVAEPRMQKVPAKALPKSFASAADKILYYVSQTEYLSTQQIIQLCYSHLAESAKKSVASRDLKALTEGKRLKSQVFGSGKIYYTSRTVNPTQHNLAIRDIYTRIATSGYELAAVDFFPTLSGLNPDLAVSFLAEDGSFIQSFWEYDAGTEGVAELVKKVERYKSYNQDCLITFVFHTRERLLQVNKTIKADFITMAVLNEFVSVNDLVFYSALGLEPRAYFS